MHVSTLRRRATCRELGVAHPYVAHVGTVEWRVAIGDGPRGKGVSKCRAKNDLVDVGEIGVVEQRELESTGTVINGTESQAKRMLQ